jgi:hypothetical protein
MTFFSTAVPSFLLLSSAVYFLFVSIIFFTASSLLKFHLFFSSSSVVIYFLLVFIATVSFLVIITFSISSFSTFLTNIIVRVTIKHLIDHD